MTFVSVNAWREWTAAMPGDVVRDGSGSPWRIERAIVEPGSRDGDGARVVWVELRGGVGGATSRVLRIPDSTKLVELGEGPGHGVTSASDEALTWASVLVDQVLGGTVLGTPDPGG